MLWSAFSQGVDNHDLKFLLLFISIFLFFLGLMLIDYGASFKGVDQIAFQSLLFESIDARIVYHLGVLMVFYSCLISHSLAFHHIVRQARRCPTCGV